MTIAVRGAPAESMTVVVTAIVFVMGSVHGGRGTGERAASTRAVILRGE